MDNLDRRIGNGRNPIVISRALASLTIPDSRSFSWHERRLE